MDWINWDNFDHKAFWKTARACLWTALVVFALLFLTKIWEIPDWLKGWVFLVYFAALWVVVFKIVRWRT